MSQEERAAFEAEGLFAHWRFWMPNSGGAVELTPQPGHVEWNDMVRGRATVDLGSLSDPVLNRADASSTHSAAWWTVPILALRVFCGAKTT